jgi:enamine deaminase RidA (YjgF/YER057c/UK114 family)
MIISQSHLARVQQDLRDIHDDIGYFATPLNEIYTLLGDIDSLLHEPENLDKKLGEILTITQSLETACKSGEWIPEVGQEAKAAAEFLDGVNILIKEIRTTLTGIQESLKPFTEWIKGVEEPVGKAWKPIGLVEGKLETMVNISSRLLKHYGGNPPDNIEHCAAALDNPLHGVAQAMNDAKDRANAALNDAERPLRTAVHQLEKIVDYTAFIDGIYHKLDGFRRDIDLITKAVNKALHYTKTAIEEAISDVARRFRPKTYKKVKAMLDSVQKAVENLKKKFINYAFKPVRDLVNQVEGEIVSKLVNLPEVAPIRKALSEVTEAISSVKAAIDSLSDPCAALFQGATTEPC